VANALEYALYYATGRTAGGVSGEHALVLGFPDASKIGEVAMGNFIAFDQDIDVTDMDYVQMWIRGECHVAFALEIIVDGAVVENYAFAKPYITKNVFMPVGLNVSGITGMHNLKYRLKRIA